MKKILKVVGVALCLVAFTQNSNAQVKFSAGIELAMPIGDFAKTANLGYGVSGSAEKAIGENMGVTGTLGYLIMPFNKDESGIDGNFSMMPIQAGFKYYFTDNTGGAYAKADLGFHRTVMKIDFGGGSVTNSSTDLSYAIGGGYLINEKIDLGLRYQMVATDGSSSAYLGVRAAYQF
ncbi:porin family protein [Vicingus serpentipes]|jgi:outer membrane protein with beta-barrel domain|uniref:Porin family protein n=1 Tax=Vicingus serpentipes TaxID=1926625 RepID=A0A5C6RSL3_9FLAO|nr:outer membrane beta-barrel protein [Vicingus serpentipes]TXB65436.1 porin family protein [Vicingus serpentipes]